MLKSEIEKVYIVKKGNKKLVIELHRTEDGKLFVVPVYTLKHKYETKEGSEKEWEYDTSKAEEINYMDLPKNIREALSRLQIF